MEVVSFTLLTFTGGVALLSLGVPEHVSGGFGDV